MMTSQMTSHCGLKFGALYSFMNEITTYFMIPKKRADISSLNFLCISVRRLLLHLCKRVFMTSLMTSPGHKVGQILKLIYLRQYRSKTMAILLLYSTSGITSGKKFVATWKWRPFWKFWNWYISVNIWARASIKHSKYRKCLWLSCWYILLPV